MLEHQILTMPCFLPLLPFSHGNSIPRRISFPILSHGGAHSHAPVSLVKSPSVPGDRDSVCLLPGCGQSRDVAGREPPPDSATLLCLCRRLAASSAR